MSGDFSHWRMGPKFRAESENTFNIGQRLRKFLSRYMFKMSNAAGTYHFQAYFDTRPCMENVEERDSVTGRN